MRRKMENILSKCGRFWTVSSQELLRELGFDPNNSYEPQRPLDAEMFNACTAARLHIGFSYNGKPVMAKMWMLIMLPHEVCYRPRLVDGRLFINSGQFSDKEIKDGDAEKCWNFVIINDSNMYSCYRKAAKAAKHQHQIIQETHFIPTFKELDDFSITDNSLKTDWNVLYQFNGENVVGGLFVSKTTIREYVSTYYNCSVYLAILRGIEVELHSFVVNEDYGNDFDDFEVIKPKGWIPSQDYLSGGEIVE